MIYSYTYFAKIISYSDGVLLFSVEAFLTNMLGKSQQIKANKGKQHQEKSCWKNKSLIHEHLCLCAGGLRHEVLEKRSGEIDMVLKQRKRKVHMIFKIKTVS